MKMKTMMLVFKRSLRKTMMSWLIGGLETTRKNRRMIGFRGSLMTTKRTQMMVVEGSSDGAGRRLVLQQMD